MPSNANNLKATLPLPATSEQELCRSSRNTNKEKSQSTLKDTILSATPETTYKYQYRSSLQKDTTKASTKECTPGKDSPRKNNPKKLHVASLRSYVEYSFDIESVNKPIK